MRNSHSLDRGLTHFPGQRGMLSYSTFYLSKGRDNIPLTLTIKIW